MPPRKASSAEAAGRIRKARAFLAAAEQDLARASDTAPGDPLMSNAVLAAIAYADALSIKVASLRNDEDHSALPRTLRRALGNRLPKGQETRLRRILAMKNEIQYEHRIASVAEARELVVQVRRFADWAELEYVRP